MFRMAVVMVKLEYLGSGRLQTNFSEGGAFLVNWAVAPPG